MTKKFQDCIDACLRCATECNRCAHACLHEPEVKLLIRCVQLNQQCAAVCLLAADMMSEESEFAERICALCAEICQACALECLKHEHLEHCSRCAAICAGCAEECRSMSKIRI